MNTPSDDLLPLDVDRLRADLDHALRGVRVDSIVVQEDRGLVLVALTLPDLTDDVRLAVQDRAHVDLRVVEAQYSARGYVFAPVFEPASS